VISFWLAGNTPVAVSWKSLVEVLEQPFVGEKGLAMKLREKGGMIISETAGLPGATEREVQPQEINGDQRSRGKKRSAEEKLVDNGDQQPERQGTYPYTSELLFSYNIILCLYSYILGNSIMIMYTIIRES
jgi:hypothetical protein